MRTSPTMYAKWGVGGVVYEGGYSTLVALPVFLSPCFFIALGGRGGVVHPTGVLHRPSPNNFSSPMTACRIEWFRILGEEGG